MSFLGRMCADGNTNFFTQEGGDIMLKHSPILAGVLLVFALLFGIQSIAEAASISSRVRILESKVYKNTKEIKRLKKEQTTQKTQLESGLNELHSFKEEVAQMILDLKKQKKKKKQAPYKEYAYP